MYGCPINRYYGSEENPSVSEDFVIGNLMNYIVVASLSVSLINFKILTIIFIIKEQKKNRISLSDIN